MRLLSPSGKPLDLTSPYHGWAAAPTWRPGLSERARRNRMLLVEAMFGAGFSNCQEEFWHYSYGDAAWAVRTGAPYCIYGLTGGLVRSARGSAGPVEGQPEPVPLQDAAHGGMEEGSGPE